MYLKCAVPCCQTTQPNNDNISFFLVPSEPVLREKWIDAAKLYMIRKNKIKICGHHFGPDDFDYSNAHIRLRPFTVPSRYLPPDSDVWDTVRECYYEQKKKEHSSSNTDYLQKIQVFNVRSISEQDNNVTNSENIVVDCSNCNDHDSNKKDLLKLKKRSMSKRKRSKINKHFLKLSLPIDIDYTANLRENKDNKLPYDSKTITSLLLHKIKPQYYKSIRDDLGLPTASKIRHDISTINFTSGINTEILNFLAPVIRNLSMQDRYCALLFKKITIRENIVYNDKMGLIDGFSETTEHKRTIKFANVAFIFMVRGLKNSWSLPIAAYFNNSLNNLSSMVREVIYELQNIGLKVVCSISTQDIENVNAVKELQILFNPNNCWYKINEEKIYHVYDPMYLILGIRNLLRNRNIKTVDGIASWKHLLLQYEIDSRFEPFNHLKKITKDHLNPDGPLKDKVHLASQVFSQTFAAVVMKSANCGIGSNKEVEGTAKFLLKMDVFYDSLDGYKTKAIASKPFKCAISKYSGHTEYWQDFLKDISKWVLYTDDKIDGVMPPTVYNLKSCLNNITELWDVLRRKGYKSLAGRNINLSALDHFIDKICASCVLNHNPTCTQILISMRHELIDSLLSGKNALIHFLKDSAVLNDAVLNIMNYTVNEQDGDLELLPYDIDEEFPENANDLKTFKNLSGDVLKLMITENYCAYCDLLLLDGLEPSILFVETVFTAVRIVRVCLTIFPHLMRLRRVVHKEISDKSDWSWFTCEEHKEMFKKSLSKVVLKNVILQWCSFLNSDTDDKYY